MMLIDLHKNWKNHNIVTDEMVNKLKKTCGCKPYEGLMDVSKDDHERILGPIPKGMVAWLKVDRRLPLMDMYCLNKEQIVYTTPYGNLLANSN